MILGGLSTNYILEKLLRVQNWSRNSFGALNTLSPWCCVSTHWKNHLPKNYFPCFNFVSRPLEVLHIEPWLIESKFTLENDHLPLKNETESKNYKSFRQKNWEHLSVIVCLISLIYYLVLDSFTCLFFFLHIEPYKRQKKRNQFELKTRIWASA